MATWENIDREAKVWTIPIADNKSKKVRKVPLSAAAIKVLDDVGTEGKSPYLFINPVTKKRLTTISKVWNRLRNKAGLPAHRIHDLRHAFCSMLAQAGVPIYTISKLAGHSNVSTTQRYSHLAPESQQKATNVAADKILKAMEAIETAS